MDGVSGADSLVGGNGNDLYIVSDSDVEVHELANGGPDEIRPSLNSYVIPAHVENFRFTGSDSLTVTRNTEANLIIGGMTKRTLFWCSAPVQA